MRCNNCGWSNPDDQTKCTKCDALLKSGSTPVSPPTAMPNTPPPIASSFEGAQTMMGQRASMPALDTPSTPSPVPPPLPARKAPVQEMPNKKEMITCPNCGYPNAANSRECGRCDTELSGTALINKRDVQRNHENPEAKLLQEQPVEQKREPQQRRIVPDEPTEKKLPPPPSGGATMNPWSKSKVNKFSLRPLSREGENFNIKLDFEGDSELNRANLEPTNLTITSKVQAKIEYRDGSWHIENQSSQQTTFIRVDGAMKLEKGDILLMGDRMFEFDC